MGVSRGLRIHRGISAFVAAEPRNHGGSPRIHSGGGRFSAPINGCQSRCALALGTFPPTRRADSVLLPAYLEIKLPPTSPPFQLQCPQRFTIMRPLSTNMADPS